MIKLLIGGSPCTFWSIAQTAHRETKAEGMGWELFKNYLIAKEKFKPDFFLYENNKSAAQAIKDQIKDELKVTDHGQFDLFVEDSGARYIEINSALVSAQNRQRFYVHNCGNVEQPKDREILLKDILECGEIDKEKSHSKLLKLSDEYFKGGKNGNLIGMTEQGEGKYRKNGYQPSQQYRIYSCEGKTQAVNTIASENYIVPMKVNEATKKGYTEIFAGDCVDLTQPNSKTRRGCNMKDKCNCLTTSTQYYQYCGTIDKPIYEIKDGMITIKDKQYPIKLKDGYYIIRKLTVKECARLQTMPDDYCRVVSDSQAYKALGNGWTAEVVRHILNGALENVSRDEEIVVLSMYDGIATGRYILDKMGFKNVKYYAYEIDKHAIQIAKSNYPDIIELGDAFQLREDDWKL